MTKVCYSCNISLFTAHDEKGPWNGWGPWEPEPTISTQRFPFTCHPSGRSQQI